MTMNKFLVLSLLAIGIQVVVTELVQFDASGNVVLDAPNRISISSSVDVIDSKLTTYTDVATEISTARPSFQLSKHLNAFNINSRRVQLLSSSGLGISGQLPTLFTINSEQYMIVAASAQSPIYQWNATTEQFVRVTSWNVAHSGITMNKWVFFALNNQNYLLSCDNYFESSLWVLNGSNFMQTGFTTPFYAYDIAYANYGTSKFMFFSSNTNGTYAYKISDAGTVTLFRQLDSRPGFAITTFQIGSNNYLAFNAGNTRVINFFRYDNSSDNFVFVNNWNISNGFGCMRISSVSIDGTFYLLAGAYNSGTGSVLYRYNSSSDSFVAHQSINFAQFVTDIDFVKINSYTYLVLASDAYVPVLCRWNARLRMFEPMVSISMNVGIVYYALGARFITPSNNKTYVFTSNDRTLRLLF